jgi:hypothetical protein
MIKVATRTKFLLLASALSPGSVLTLVIEVNLGLTADFPPSRGFVLFHVPYQDLLGILFFVGIFAFALSIFSLVHDHRTVPRIPWLNQ